MKAINERGDWAGLSKGSQSIMNKTAKQTAHKQLLKIFGQGQKNSELQKLSDKFKAHITDSKPREQC